MDILSLIQLLQNKVNILSNARALAFSSGDLDRMNAIDNDLLSTQNTLSQLVMLQAATQAAAQSNIGLADLVTAGVQSAQSAMTIPDNPTAVLSQYDISTYASDPLYIQKITDMLGFIPSLDNSSEIDAYIASQVVGSPITGTMVMNAATTYSVDTRLMVAIMELDSRLGTAGVGAQTYNPGNMGNTGTSTQTYASWADGVAAVAAWLSQHMVVSATVTPVVVPVTTASSTIAIATSTPATTTASSTSATSTDPMATQTPTPTPFVPPPVPAIVATSTPTFINGVATSSNATSTINDTGTTTTSSSGVGSTTDATTASTTIASPTSATSTPPVATTTPPIPAFNDDPASSTPATSTPVVSDNSSSTPAVDTATSTGFVAPPPVTQAATSTDQQGTASTTQARRMTKRIRV